MPTHPHPGARVLSGGYRPSECPVRLHLHLTRGFRGPERHSSSRTPLLADDPSPPAAFGALVQLPSVVPLLPPAAFGVLARRLLSVGPVRLAFAANQFLNRPRVQTGARIFLALSPAPSAPLLNPDRRLAGKGAWLRDRSSAPHDLTCNAPQGCIARPHPPDRRQVGIGARPRARSLASRPGRPNKGRQD